MVMVGYLLSGLVAALVFFSLGPVAFLLSPLLMIVFGIAAGGNRDALRRSHYWFQFRTQIWLLLALSLVYLLPLWWLWGSFDPDGELVALLNTRDSEAIRAWVELWLAESVFAAGAWTGSAMALLFFYMVLHALVSMVIGIWLSIRLVRRLLRWTDRLPA
jgi:uncharacterized membrane protein